MVRAAKPRRIAFNFAALSVAEVLCRGTSVAVTLYLARCLGTTGLGRIEFAFNVVFWLVLIVRDGLEVIASREIARHPRLIRPLVNHVLAVKLALALALLAGLVVVGACAFSDWSEWVILTLYGLMLISTALGLDFVYRGTERMTLVAVSLILRTAIYAVGVFSFVADIARITWVPAFLVGGEICGIALVWLFYARRFGLPRPAFGGGRFLRVFLRRGRSVYLIQVSQAVLGTIDLLIVGLMSEWEDVGLYAAPHRMVTAVLTFGLIFQQVVFPTLARSWRGTPVAGRSALESLVRILMAALVPLAVGATVLAGPLVHYLFTDDYAGASMVLALGIWRAPLLTVAYLYQTALIALNRESVGVRMLLTGALSAGPLAAALCWKWGLPGAAAAMVMIALALLVAGHWRLQQEGRGPAWHHYAARPLLASLAMTPVCLLLLPIHVLVAVLGGAITYFAVLLLLGALRREDLALVWARNH
jgi:O-antigen/teichoic acid export membrane protein